MAKEWIKEWRKNDEMFVVACQSSGMIRDDYGELYRSDTKDWKDIYLNQKELNNLAHYATTSI